MEPMKRLLHKTKVNTSSHVNGHTYQSSAE